MYQLHEPVGTNLKFTLMTFFRTVGVWVPRDFLLIGVSPLLRGVLGGKFSSNNSGLRWPPKDTRLLFKDTSSFLPKVRNTNIKRAMQKPYQDLNSVKLVLIIYWNLTPLFFCNIDKPKTGMGHLERSQRHHSETPLRHAVLSGLDRLPSNTEKLHLEVV